AGGRVVDVARRAKAKIQGPQHTVHLGREVRHDRVAVDPRDRRGGKTEGHTEVPDPFRSCAARAGSRGAIDPRRDGPGRRRGAGGVEPGPGTVRGGGAGDSQAPGALGPGGRARAEGLRNGATTAERPDRFSGTRAGQDESLTGPGMRYVSLFD